MSERPEAVGALFCESDIPIQKITSRREMVAIRTTGQSVGTVFFAIRRFALFSGRMNFMAQGVYWQTSSVIDSNSKQPSTHVNDSVTETWRRRVGVESADKRQTKDIAEHSWHSKSL